MDSRCIECFRRSFCRLSDVYQVTPENRLAFFKKFAGIANIESRISAPEAQRNLIEIFNSYTGNIDPYKKEKTLSNTLALQLYKEWKPQVVNSDDPFDIALRLAIAGNIMDYAASANFDINKTIYRVLTSNFAIDDSNLLKTEIINASRILYLGDNAGEIVFDKLFIEIMNHKAVTYAVRGSNVLNDATKEDAKATGIKKVAKVISNGYNAPSTILNHCSKEFNDAFKKADLIISKGQGNLEGLYKVKDSRIFFLLTVKCDVMAEILKVEKGSFVVMKQKNNE